MSRRSLLWSAAAVAGVALLWAGADAWLRDAVLWCRDAGWAGVAVFAALYCATAVALVPAAVLTVAAGWIWGFAWGAVLIQLVSIPADLIPFVIARRLGRARLRGWLARRGRADALARVDERMRDRGFVAVSALRLAPFAPFNVVSYLLGLTAVRTSTYVVASTVASVPNTVVFVYLGAAAATVDELHRAGSLWSSNAAWVGAGLAATAACAAALVAMVRTRAAP